MTSKSPRKVEAAHYRAISRVVAQTFGATFKVRRPMRLGSEYAEKFTVIPPGVSHHSGPYRNDMAPHLVEIMDAVTDPANFMVVVMGPAQGRKSTLFERLITYYSHWEPSPILLLHPTGEMAESFARDRVGPLFRHTPVLKDLVGTGRRDSSNTLMYKGFPGGFLAMGSGNTANSYIQRPIRIAGADDFDQFAQDIEGQGDPLTLLFKRTETFPTRKVIVAGSPLDVESSHLYRAWLKGDRRISVFPCPECEEFQPIVSERFVYEKEEDGTVIPSSVFYPCEHCGVLIPGSKADWMRANMKYRKHRKSRGIASFWI